MIKRLRQATNEYSPPRARNPSAFQVLCEMKKHPLLHTIPVAMLSGLQDESLGEHAACCCLLMLLLLLLLLLLLFAAVVVVVVVVIVVVSLWLLCRLCVICFSNSHSSPLSLVHAPSLSVGACLVVLSSVLFY